MSASSTNNIYRSVIDLKSCKKDDIYFLFEKALQLKNNFDKQQANKINGTAALLFFEPSTRTRFSFESACVRSGVHPLVLSGALGSSLEKGESFDDTVLNIEATKPLFFVIRCPENFNLIDISKKLSTPIINAGWGMQGHPTQALLDILTVYENNKTKGYTIDDVKILFVGDIKHSRVVQSHLELSRVLGYKIGYACPAGFLPSNIDREVMYFSDLKDGLQWANVLMSLRVQKERHIGVQFSIEDYKESFGINNKSLMNLKSGAIIMHPGPINYGIEIEKEVLGDDRVQILKMVENGTFLREALIRQIINREC